MPSILGIMESISSIGPRTAERRKSLRMSQAELALRAGISRATIDALENGRIGELGFSKVTRILTVLGLELKLQETSSRRPTLEDLLEEERNDQSMGRRH